AREHPAPAGRGEAGARAAGRSAKADLRVAEAVIASGDVHRPRLAVTVGDPRGIGPEIIRAALEDPALRDVCDLIVIGPEGADVPVGIVSGSWAAGDGLAAAGKASGDAIALAVKLALAGEVDGIVTAPIDKFALLSGGYDYPGHTEMLAELTASRVAMML